MAEAFEVKVTGHEDLVRLMVEAGAHATDILGRAIKESADDIFRESQEQVPFRHGPLRASGRITGPTISGSDVIVMLSYGNSAVQYAEYQHAGVRADGTHRIRNYHNGKKDHYLSDPVNDAIPTMGASIAMRIEEMFR
jgi:hypothetical protein